MNICGIKYRPLTMTVAGLLVSFAIPLGAFGQDWKPFSGEGFKNFSESMKSATPPLEKPNWSGMFKKPTFEMPKPQKLNWPKLGLFKNMNSDAPAAPPAMMNGIPSLFNDPQVRPAAFLEDMSTRSREFFNQTSNGFTDWATRTNENARTRTAETWEALRNGFRNPLKRPTAPPAVQPPVRSANNFGSQTKVKF